MVKSCQAMLADQVFQPFLWKPRTGLNQKERQVEEKKIFMYLHITIRASQAAASPAPTVT